MITRLKSAFLTVICTLVVACGGGGGGGGGFLPDNGGAPLTLGTTALPPLAAVPYAEVLQASGGVEPYSWEMVDDDGTGLTIDENGVLRANVGASPGRYAITIRVTDSGGDSDQLTLTIDVELPLLAISTTALPAAPEGVAYTAILEAEGGEAPLEWELVSDGGTGLTVSPGGLLTGSPTAQPGTYGLTFRVTDSNGLEDTRSLLLEITGDLPGPLTIVTASLPGATERERYAAVLLAEGGSGDYSWSLVNDGFSGLSLSETGVLSGVGPAEGSYGITVQVNDGLNIRTAALVLTVAGFESSLAISTSSVDQAFPGTPYAAVLQASGGEGAYTWSPVDLGGTGFTLSPDGVLRGIPGQTGVFAITVRVSDANGDSVVGSVTVVVGAAGSPDSDFFISTGALPPGTAGQSYAVVLRSFPSGDEQRTWAVRPDGSDSDSGLPGFALGDDTVGLLSSPALPGAGEYTLVIEVREASAPDAAVKVFTLTVNP